jgi:hypothetical protein
MTTRSGTSSRQVHPRRMPTMTHWRTVAPPAADDSPTWVEHRIPQSVRAPSGDRPDVTTRAWVRWAEARMRQERALQAEEPVAGAGQVPDDREASGSPATPVAPAEAAAARRTPLLMGVAAALVLVLAAGVWWWGGRSDTDPTDRARAVSAAAAPRSPVALPADGEHVLIRVLESGDLGVEQWVRHTDARGTLMIAPPAGISVHDLSVVAGSRPVDAPTSLDGATEISFPARSTLYLSYRLSGALELSDDNRALARVISVALGDQPGQQTVDFVGATVLSLACAPTSGDATPVPCGADAGSKGWRVVPPAGVGDVQVMAQLDLTLG